LAAIKEKKLPVSSLVSISQAILLLIPLITRLEKGMAVYNFELLSGLVAINTIIYSIGAWKYPILRKKIGVFESSETNPPTRTYRRSSRLIYA
jgi:hypothetical protein